MTDISNHDDVIDSRDVIARIEELEQEYEGLKEELDGAIEEWEARDPEDNEAALHRSMMFAQEALADWNDNNKDELASLKNLAEQCEGYGNWDHGETLIRRSHWVDYVQELLEDIGDIPKDLPGYLVIDWEATARNIEADYMTVDFDGVEYLIRC